MNKFFTVLCCLLCMSNVLAGHAKLPSWSWSAFKLNEWFDKNDQYPSQLAIETDILACTQNMNDDSCDDVSAQLVLLSRMDAAKTLELSDQLLGAIPDESTHDLYYLRQYALRAKAISGAPEGLNIFLDTNGASIEDAYVMAQVSQWDEAIFLVKLLELENSTSYCKSTLYLNPFISGTEFSQQVYDLLLNNVNNLNPQISGCALVALINHYDSDLTFAVIYNKIIKYLVGQEPIRLPQVYIALNKWNIPSNDISTISNLIKITIQSESNQVRFFSSKVLIDHSILFAEVPLSNLQENAPDLQTNLYGEKYSVVNYLLEEPFNSQWLIFESELQFTQILPLVLRMKELAVKVPDLELKVQKLFNNAMIASNNVLKRQLMQVAYQNQISIPENMLENVFEESGLLQKLTMMKNFSTLLSDERIIRYQGNDIWIKFAETLNLMSLCGIEPEVINSEEVNLSDIQNYVKKAESDLSLCSRLKN